MGYLHVKWCQSGEGGRRAETCGGAPRYRSTGGELMRVLFDIGHPGHVHLFRHAIRQLTANGHEVLVTAGEKDVTVRLLREYAIPYVSLGRSGGGIAVNCGRTALSTMRLLKTAVKFSPDLFVAVSPVRAAPVAGLLGRQCLGLDDTEHARLAHRVYGPFVTMLLTPECYGLDVGPEQRRYRGYHELAYLHPRYFTPDAAVLECEGVSAERFRVRPLRRVERGPRRWPLRFQCPRQDSACERTGAVRSCAGVVRGRPVRKLPVMHSTRLHI